MRLREYFMINEKLSIKQLKEKIIEIQDKIDDGDVDFDIYGVRFHRDTKTKINKPVPDSFEWLDGDITDIELDGTCAVNITYSTPDKLLRMIDQYAWGKGEYIIIAGDYYEYGHDAGEIIIKNAIRVA